MKIGTKSVLFGAHCFFLHPFYVAIAWTKLYGFPWDPRLWFAFFLHDIGYFGRPDMDGEEGERHPEVGSKIMHWLFDGWWDIEATTEYDWGNRIDYYRERRMEWHDFCLYHSRHYAKQAGAKPSRLCFADKLAFCYQPKWLYIWMTAATGELSEYLANAKYWNKGEYVKAGTISASQWFADLKIWIRDYVEKHKDGAEDLVTVDRRVSATKY